MPPTDVIDCCGALSSLPPHALSMAAARIVTASVAGTLRGHVHGWCNAPRSMQGVSNAVQEGLRGMGAIVTSNGSQISRSFVAESKFAGDGPVQMRRDAFNVRRPALQKSRPRRGALDLRLPAGDSKSSQLEMSWPIGLVGEGARTRTRPDHESLEQYIEYLARD